MNLLSLFCITCCVFSSTITSATNSSDDDLDGKTPLYFAYITTLTGEFTAGGGMPVVDMALQEINFRDDILQNYTLKHTEVFDSGVSIIVCIIACESTVTFNFKPISNPPYNNKLNH